MSRPALPWGEAELEEFKILLLTEVNHMYSEGVDLKQDGMTSSWGAYSPHGKAWQISQDRAVQMNRDIMRWQPREPVIAEASAAAVRTVYEGLSRWIHWSDRRLSRQGYVG